MEYKGIRKIHEGKFITRYDVDYITAQGKSSAGTGTSGLWKRCKTGRRIP